MSIDPLGILIFLLGLVALVRGPSFAFSVFIPCTLLGSAAAITSDTITIQPAHLLLGFLIVVVFSRSQYVTLALEGLSFPLPGFWLLCTLIYGALGAFLFPRLLAGLTYVISVNGRSDSGVTIYPIPLAPNSTNFTQSVYFFGDLLCFLLCYSYARTAEGFRCIFNALMYYSIGNIVFAALDLATFWTGTAYLLEFIRNAGYVLHTETMVLGIKRIVGSFTETSSFASTTIGIFGFTGRLWLLNILPSVTFPVAMISLFLLIFSTSSTAYATLPVLLFYLYFGSFWGVMRGRGRLKTVGFLLVAPLLLAIVVVSILLYPTVSSSIYDFMDVLLFDKSSSQSGIERNMMNEVSLNNFFETFGLGTGIGGARASSFAIAMLANLGVFGTATYVLFLYKLLAAPTASSDQISSGIRTAARTACFGLLCTSVVSGALIDLGLPFFMFAGLGCAYPVAGQLRARTKPSARIPAEVVGTKFEKRK